MNSCVCLSIRNSPQGFSPSPTSDLKIDTPVAALPGAWLYKVSAGTVWPGLSKLRLGETV